jgi:hypothetical protein
MSNYISISNFGTIKRNLPINDPITYCNVDAMESGFLHGGVGMLLNKNSKECKLYMSDYCSKNWDSVCENNSQNREPYIHNLKCDENDNTPPLTRGDILVRDTAERKYLVSFSNKCRIVSSNFDPTVSNSPVISWITNDGSNDMLCYKKYSVKPENLDNDIVMNKILEKPWIALDIIINIYKTMKKNNSYNTLQGTKLYKFFESDNFKKTLINGFYHIN